MFRVVGRSAILRPISVTKWHTGSLVWTRMASDTYNDATQAESMLKPPPMSKEYKEMLEKRAKAKRWNRYVQKGLLGLLGVAMVLVIWQPWNPYSKDVAYFLRKALWAEMPKYQDYPKAIGYYEQALAKMKEEGMSQLDMKYTGVVLKLAQVYEKMGKVDQQRDIYERLNNFLLPNIQQGNVPEEDLDKVIDRDLVVATRVVMLADRPRMKRALRELEDRLYMCEDRLQKKWPFLARLGGSQGVQYDIDQVIDIDNAPGLFSIGPNKEKRRFIDENCDAETKEFLLSWDPDWPYFLENLVRARDLYAMGNLRSDLSVDLLKSNLVLMQLWGEYPIYFGTAISNLGSAYYMKSERHEKNIKLLQEKLDEEAAKPEEEQGTDAIQLNLQMYLESEKEQQQQAIHESEHIFEKLIDRMGGADSARQSDSGNLKGCLGMALYSLGVIKLHNGDYGNSSRLLAQAKEIAAENGIEEIVYMADGESQTMEKEQTTKEMVSQGLEPISKE